MYWTLEMASKLEDAPWPATKAELIDYAQRSGLPQEILENLDELEDEGIAYDGIEGRILVCNTIDLFFCRLSSDGERRGFAGKNFLPSV